MTACYIIDSGTICAIGIGAAQCSASFRAGLSGYVQSSVVGRTSEPLVMALIPEDELEPLSHALSDKGLSDRERRMLRLGGAALRQVQQSIERPVPLFLSLPDANPGAQPYSQRSFVEHLGTQTELSFDLEASQCFEVGRAGGLFALRAAVDAIRSGRENALVAGIDSCLDLTSLARLDQERRLLGSDVKDGCVPGEGAAVLLLSRSKRGAFPAPSLIAAVGTGEDPGHRYSEAPALGIGLSAALEAALPQLSMPAQVKTCFAGLNGESVGAKEWGVARIRHATLFDSNLAFEHPADCFGDVGAAMGTLLIALADETLRTGHRAGPILIWASSDYAPRACALIRGGE